MANNVWFISDTHFNHLHAMYYKPKRREAAGISLKEFELLKENDKKEITRRHDEWLINLWNKTIKKKDSVYILGDFCLANKEFTEKLLRRLNGVKYLIRGNHDQGCRGLENYFEWVGDIKEAKFTNNQYKFINPNETFCVEMCHFPMITWNRRPHGTIMLHGHVHNALDKFNKESGELRVDVGLDAELSDYQFISLEKLYNYFKEIIAKENCNTFQEYIDKLMLKQNIRL